MKRGKPRKKLIETYKRTKSISKKAKLFWELPAKPEKKGEKGLEDLSRRPKRSPFKTPHNMEEKVLKIRKERGYGKRRISYFLLVEEGIYLSENTIRNILKRNRDSRKGKKRKVFYVSKVGI